MKAALKAVENGQSVSGAARDYGIPKTTLFDRVSGRVIHGVKPGPRPYLSPREEGTLRHFLKHCAKLGYGKTRKDVLAIAESTAIDNGLLKSSRITEGWWRHFLECQSDLSLRQGDSTAHVRMDAVNKETMDQYFSEKARKAKEREEEKARKAEEKARKAEEKSRKAAESTKKARIGMKQKAKPGVNSSNTRSETQPPPKAARMQAMHQVDNIDDGECCMCFTTYEEDIRDQSGKEWVECACGRWLHEDCAEDCVLDNDGKERLCPFCLDILS